MVLFTKCIRRDDKILLISFLMLLSFYYGASASFYNSYDYNLGDSSLNENYVAFEELQSAIIPELNENGEENLRFWCENIKTLKDIVTSDELKEFFGMILTKLSFVCNDLDAFFKQFPANITGLGIEDKRLQNYKDVMKVLAENDDNPVDYGSLMAVVTEEVRSNPNLTIFICEKVKQWLQIIKTEKFRACVQDLYKFMELGCEFQEWKQSIKNVNNKEIIKTNGTNGNFSNYLHTAFLLIIVSSIATNFVKR